MTAMRGAIEIEQVSKLYGTLQALDTISLSIAPGEFVTLLGPSGCGKSTLLRLIAGFERPSQGRILIDGVDCERTPPHRREQGMVFQGYALFPHLTVAENLAFPLQARGMAADEIRTRVGEALAMVQLGALAQRLPSALSGGQQQRVALARAVIYDPPILLMDEPLSALDKALREDMKAEIRALHRQLGLTMLFVTHDQEEALELSDRIILLRDGRIMQAGTPQELYERPASPGVAAFLGNINIFAGTLESGRPALATAGSDTVEIGIRPERLILLADGDTLPADMLAILNGVIVDAAYLGGACRYVVDVGGHRIQVRTPAHADAMLPIRAAVRVGLPRAAALIWRDGQPAQ